MTTQPPRRRRTSTGTPTGATPATTDATEETPAPENTHESSEAAQTPPEAVLRRPTAADVRRRRAPRPETQQETPTGGFGGQLFQPLTEIPEFVNALYYGKEGSGKTSAVAQMSQLGRVLVINAEGGLKTRPLKNRGVKIENIAVYPPAGQVASFDGIESAIDQLKHDLRNDPSAWAGVIVDSATEVYAACLDEAAERRVALVKQNKGVDIDRWFTDRADYGEANKKMRSLLRALRDLPCHFAVTALERRDVDEDTQKVAYGPAVSPGLATDLLGYMDVVMVTKAADEKGNYRALTKGTGRYRAKDRFDILPTVLDDPRFNRVVAIIEGTEEAIEAVEAEEPAQD